MCLILLAHRAQADLPLVVAANRDERYGRPSRKAEFWADAPQVLAGRDLEADGTWLGFTRQGRFAAVTNFRNGPRPGSARRSRGELTRGFLEGSTNPLDYARQVLSRAGDYNGFNLLLGDMENLVYCENLSNTLRALPPGTYGLSNHLLDTPWPKVVKGKNRLSSLLENWRSASRAECDQLLEILTDRQIAEDEFLPDTGVGLAAERQLSPIFIEAEHYGTCCSTALVVDSRGLAHFQERSFYGATPQEVSYRFRVELDINAGSV